MTRASQAHEHELTPRALDDAVRQLAVLDQRIAADPSVGTNVVAFPRRCHEPQKPAPELRHSADDRPARALGRDRRAGFAVFLVGSVALHVGLLAYLALAPEPDELASLGEQAISVEIVIGANSAAGVAEQPSNTEAQDQPEVEAPKPEQRQQEKQEEPKAADAEAIAPAPVEQVERKPDPPTPPIEKPKQTVETRTPQAPSAAASGVGRGASAADVKYGGAVAARLARQKRYPAEARSKREQGKAIITFEIDARGQVASVELVKSSGHAALDREAMAVVRRAAPFPPPPGGVAVSYRMPVGFQLN
jgi:protein TonB